MRVPCEAASSRMPRMLLPSTSSPFLRILTSDWKRLAVWTNLAAARAWRPRRLRMASSRSITSPLSADDDPSGVRGAPLRRAGRRRRRSTAGRGPWRRGRPRSRAGRSSAATAHFRTIGRLTPVTISTRSLREERQREVGRRAAEHVRQDDRAVPLVGLRRGPGGSSPGRPHPSRSTPGRRPRCARVPAGSSGRPRAALPRACRG